MRTRARVEAGELEGTRARLDDLAARLGRMRTRLAGEGPESRLGRHLLELHHKLEHARTRLELASLRPAPRHMSRRRLDQALAELEDCWSGLLQRIAREETR